MLALKSTLVREGGGQVLSPQYHPCLISLNYVSSVSSQTRALLDLDRIYTIPEGSSLQYSIFFWGGGVDERYVFMSIMLCLSSFLLSV